MFLPMSWTSPLTVAIRILPCARVTVPAFSARAFSSSMYGIRNATAFFIARALLTTCGRNILPAPNRSPTTFMPSISGPSIISSGRAYFCRASSRSGSRKSSTPWTRACDSRASTVLSRHFRSISRLVADPFTVSANCTIRSVASGRRLKMMSSTCSRRSFGMSSYTISWPALTMPMFRPALIAWKRNAE